MQFRKEKPTELRKQRKKRGLRQKTLAEALGVKQCTISLWETGDRKVPSDKLPAIAQALNCTIDELFGKSEKAGSK